MLATGCQGLAAGSTSSGTVGVGSGNLDFGAVVIGDTKTLPDTLLNHTSSPVTISAIQGLDSNFQVIGIKLPIVLAAGQSAPFNVQFQPAEASDPATTIGFDGSNSQPYAALTAVGKGVMRGKISSNPSPVTFLQTQVGSHRTTNVTLTNYGGTNVTLTEAALSGVGFSMSNLAMPLTLTPGQTTTFAVTFSPVGSGNYIATVAFLTTAQDSVNNKVILSIFGAGVVSGIVSPSPSSVAFGNVPVGTSSSNSETLTNTGGSPITISQISATGTGFSINALTLPVTLQSNQSVTFATNFAPTSAGAASGALNIVSTAANSTLNIALTGTGQSAGALSSNPNSANFGSVTVGNNETVSVSVTNTGGTSITISSAAATGSGFSVTAPSLPIALSPGQSAPFKVIFTPSTTGPANGALTIYSSASNATLPIALSGTGAAQGQLGSNPSSLGFGPIQINTSKSLSGSLTNSGGTSLTISAASASGAGFSLSGLALPLTLNPGQSTSFTVLFNPATSGAASGNLSITSTGSDANLNIPLSGTGMTQGALAASPANLAFGNVQVGSSTNLNATLTNSGGSSLTISSATASAGFSLSGLALPLTLNAGQSTTFTVVFNPTASGAANGSVSIVSTASDSNLSIPLSGNAAAPGTLASNPTTIAFGNVQAGTTTNLSETLTNTGGSSVTISQANLTGALFSISGLTLPLTLTANQSVTFTASFAPSSAGVVSGGLSVVSNASNSTLNVAFSGTGTSAGQLTVSPTSLSFGNVTTGSSSALNGSVTASGTSITISSASLNNGEFVLSGISLPTTLAAGQSTPFTVTFTPQASGATSASLSFSSNASNSSAAEAMTGTGTTPIQHTVSLTWDASPDAIGYNVYRGTVAGGPYQMINPSLNGTTSYTDSTVVSGQTYYYVTTAVNSNMNESGYSNQDPVVIPNP